MPERQTTSGGRRDVDERPPGILTFFERLSEVFPTQKVNDAVKALAGMKPDAYQRAQEALAYVMEELLKGAAHGVSTSAAALAKQLIEVDQALGKRIAEVDEAL